MHVDTSMRLSLQDQHNEIMDIMGQSYNLPDGLDEDDLLGELDAMEDDMAYEQQSGQAVPSYLQVLAYLPAPLYRQC